MPIVEANARFDEALARRHSEETPDRQVSRTEASVPRLWPEFRGQLDEPPEHVCSTHIRYLQSLRTEPSSGFCRPE